MGETLGPIFPGSTGGGGGGSITLIQNVDGSISVANGAGPTVTVSLPTIVTPGTVGDASHVSQITVDATGRVTTGSNVSIQIAESQVTNLVTDLGTFLVKTNNLSDVTSRGTSRFNIRVPAIASVQAASTTNVNIAAPGASIDGFTFLSSGLDSFLLTGQTTASQNGPWVWNGAASPATRPNDFPTGGTLTTGRFLIVQNGSTNNGTLWWLNVPSSGMTIDTTAQTWLSLNILGTSVNEQVIRANRLDQMSAPNAAVNWNNQTITALGGVTLFDGTAAHGQITIVLNSPLESMYANSADTQPMLSAGIVSAAPTIQFGAGGTTAPELKLSRTANGQLTLDATAAATNGPNLIVSGTGSGFGDITVLTLQADPGSSARTQFVVSNTRAVNTANKASFNLVANSSTTLRTVFQFDTSFSTTTDASRTSTVVLNTANAGVFGAVLTIVGNAITFAGNLTMSDNTNLAVGTTNGTKIGTATSQKLGFYNATPVIQPASPAANVNVTAAGATNQVFRNTTFPGASGATAYTIGDIVTALKSLGLLAA